MRPGPGLWWPMVRGPANAGRKILGACGVPSRTTVGQSWHGCGGNPLGSGRAAAAAVEARSLSSSTTTTGQRPCPFHRLDASSVVAPFQGANGCLLLPPPGRTPAISILRQVLAADPPSWWRSAPWWSSSASLLWYPRPPASSPVGPMTKSYGVPAVSPLAPPMPSGILSWAVWLIKRTYQPSLIRKKRKSGYLSRRTTTGGRKILRRRRQKGRARLFGA